MWWRTRYLIDWQQNKTDLPAFKGPYDTSNEHNQDNPEELTPNKKPSSKKLFIKLSENLKP